MKRGEIEAFDADVLAVLRRLTRSDGGALWTGDIAYSVRQRVGKSWLPVSVVRGSLKRLEAKGLARRVVVGNPTSWEAEEWEDPS